MPLQQPSFFIFGANTDVGKTLFSTGLCFGATALNLKTRYIKPVQTGVPEHSDAATVAAHCPKVETHTLLALRHAVSPHRALRDIPTSDAEVFLDLKNLLSKKENPFDFTLIEGAGGPASPTPDGQLQCDFFRPLRLPVVLVGDSKLGGISTTLTAHHMLHARGYDVVAIVLFKGEDENHLFLKKQSHLPPVFAIAAPESQKDVSPPLSNWLNTHKNFWVDLCLFLKKCHQANEEHIQKTIQGTENSIWWPFTQHQQVRETTYIDSAYGMHFQTQKGLLYDGSASWWTQGPGHGHPDLTNAVAYASGRYGHVLFPRHAHHPAYELAEALLNTVGTGWAERVFYSDNGSTAVEVGLKMAFGLSAKRQNVSAKTSFIVLGLKDSYHGDTLGAMEATSPDVFKARSSWYTGRGIWLDFPEVICKDGLFHVSLPNSIGYVQNVTSHCLDDLFAPAERTTQHPGLAAAYRAYICDQIQQAQALGAQTPEAQGVIFGALILEGLVHGSHGMRMIDPLFQKILCEVAQDQGIPVVFDEVFSGLWRLGPASAAQALGIRPDIACFGKLLTGGLLALGATLATHEVFAAFEGPGVEQALLHGHSYAGNPVACAVGVEALGLIKKSPYFCTKTQILGPFWPAEAVKELSCHKGVRRVVCLGSLLALELESLEGGYSSLGALELVKKLETCGIEVRPLGNVVYIFAGFYESPAVVEDIIMTGLASV